MINTRLFTRADIEQILKSNDEQPSGSITEIGICPIVELIELCESVKKRKSKSSIRSFRQGLQMLSNEPYGEIHIVNLDSNCLTDSLFECDDDHRITGLWEPAANREISPAHSLRRLLLRPSNQTWWDSDEIYAESETIYGGE